MARREKESSKIEELKEKLYQRDFSQEDGDVRSSFYTGAPDVTSSWGTDKNNTDNDNKIPELFMKKNSFFKKLFFSSVVFFVVALGIALLLFFGGGNTVSSDNVDIEILGPVSTEGGNELSLQIVITNNNNTVLEFTDLLLTYPEGTRSADDITEELLRFRKSLGSIKSGETVNEITRAVLFGQEGSEKKIGITLEYRVEGSNAIFVKETDYLVAISSSPVNVLLEVLDEVNVNQEMDVTVRVSSNSETVARGIALEINYPFGFEPTEFTPEASFGNSIWELGDIAPNSTTTITVRGIMRGQDNEERIFSVAAGAQDPKNERKIAIVYSSSFRSVNIKRPFIGVFLTLNGQSDQEYITNGGETIRGSLTWTNNTPTQITDAIISVDLLGEALDDFSVTVDRGFYDSSANTILWDKRSLSDLESLEPGETGRISFTFAPKSLLSQNARSLRDPEIKLSVSASGKRVSEGGAQDQINAFVEKVISVNTALQLTSRAVYFNGALRGSGPLPPQAEQKTTYTVLWSVLNSSNDVSNAKVRAFLPSYVSWAGVVSPLGTAVSYNSGTGEVVWDIGDIDAGAGTVSAAKEVAFQVTLLPSISHIGTAPEILTGIVLSGRDDFTNQVLMNNRPSLTTDLITDPQFNPSQAQVAP